MKLEFFKEEQSGTAPTLSSTSGTATIEVGVAGSVNVGSLVSGGSTPMTFTPAVSSKPAGVTLTQGTHYSCTSAGVMSFTPPSAGTYVFTVTVANGTTPNATYTWTVTAVVAPVWDTISAIDTTVDDGVLEEMAPYLTAGNPAPTITVTSTGANTPTGTYEMDTGYFCFYPDASDAGKTFVFTFTASNAGGSATATMTVNVAALEYTWDGTGTGWYLKGDWNGWGTTHEMITDADFGSGNYSRVTVNNASGSQTFKWHDLGSRWIGVYGDGSATPAKNTAYVLGGGTWGGNFSSSIFTSGKYYTFRGKFYVDPGNENERVNDFVIMETTGAPTEFVSAGAGNPSGTVGASAQTVSVTLNHDLNTEERVYVRYKAGDAAWATAELNSGSGTTRSGTIPAQTVGKTVSYYFLTTTVPKATLDAIPDGVHANADLCTLNGLKNVANNWSYTVAAASVTASAVSGAALTATHPSASSGYQSFTVNGSRLTGALTVTAPSGFAICSTAGGTYVNELTLTPSGSTLGTTTVYVKLAANTTSGPQSGNVSISGGGLAANVTVAVTGTVKPAALTLTAAQGTTPGTVTLTVSGREGTATVNVRRYTTTGDASSDTTGTGGTQVTAANANGTFTDSGLDGCKTYYYKAWQTLNSQTSAATGTQEAKTKLATPDVRSSASSGSIQLDWPTVKGAVNYTVEIATDDTFATGGAGATLLSMDFEDGTPTTDWTIGGSANTDHAQAGKCRQLTAGAQIVTPAVNNPAQISFYVNMSKGGKNKTYYVYYADPDDENWSNSLTFTTEDSAKTVTLDFPANVGEVEICIASDYSSIYIDNIVVTGASGGGTMMDGYPATVAQVAAGVTNVSHALSGLTNGVTYSYRVTANGAESCEMPSSIGHETPTAALAAPVWGTIAAITRMLAQGQLSKDMSAELTTAGNPAPTFAVTMNTGSPTPAGAYSVVSGTGAFTFTPALADAGKTFTFKFTASNSQGSPTQTMAVTVTGGTLTLTGSFSKFSAAAGAASLAQTVTLTGSNLGNGESVTVAVGAPFEVSLPGNDNDYGSSRTVTATSAGAISSQTVYVRVAASASQGNNQTGTLQAYCTSAGGSGSAVTKSLTADVSGESTATSIEKSFIVVNDGTRDEWFNGSGSDQTHNFSEYYLGEFTSLKLAGEAGTRNDGVASGHVVTMNYTVDSGTEGAWSTLTMPWKEWDDPLNKHQSHDGAGNLTYTPDLASGRAPGLYYIRVFFSQVTTSGTIYDSRGSLNYVASFRVPLTTPTISSVTSARVVSLSGKDAGATYVVVRKDSDTGWGTPTGGLPTAGNDNWCGGTVVYVGTDSSFTDTTAAGCARYYYKAWTKSGSENVWSAGSASYHSPTMATPVAPVLNALSSVTYEGFTASWNAVPGAVTYRMDIVKGSTTTTSDTLTRETTGVTSGNTTYTSWSNKTGESGAKYAGKTAGSNNSIQMNATSGNAIWTTVSGGTARKVTIEWESHTTSGRYITVYGSNDALSGDSGGTSVGTIIAGTSTELTIAGDYKYLRFKANNAVYVSSLTVDWEESDETTVWDNVDVGSLMTESAGVVSVAVTGLDEMTAYSVTVRSEGATPVCKSGDSNTESATTEENTSVTSVTISDADGDGGTTAVPAGAVAAGETVLVQGTKLTVAAGSVNPVLTGVTFTTTGTATGSDIGTLRVRVGTSSTYAGNETALGAVTYTGAGTYTVSGSQTLTADATYYVWIEAVTEAGAVGGSTVKVSALTTDSFSITNGRKSGSTTAAGTQTIGNLTAFAAATGATAGGQIDLTWTAGAGGTVTVRWSTSDDIPGPGTAWANEETGLTGGSHTLTGLTGCQAYYLKAWEVVGGAACGTALAATASASAPAAPTAPLEGTALGAHEATLTWGAAAGASGYSVDVWHYASGSGGGSGSGGIAGTYTRITAAGQLEAGNYVIVATNTTQGLTAMGNTVEGSSTKYIGCVDVSDDKTASSLTLTADNADIVWNLAYDGETETWSFRNAACNEGAGGYAGYAGSGNSGNIYDTLDNKSRWTMGVSDGLWTVANVGVSTRFLRYNASSPRFACYTNGQVKLMLFKQAGGSSGGSGGGGSGGSGTPIPDVTANEPQTVDGVLRTISFPTATSASVGNLDEGTTYHWSVTATGSGGCEGGTADGPSFATTELLGAPTVAAWTGLAGGQVTGTVTRASASATVLLKRYESLTDANNDMNGHEVAVVATETATLVKFDDSGLAGCKTYWYKARQTATVEGDEPTTSAWSAPVSAEATLAAPVMDPDPPVGAGTSLTLSWQPVAGAFRYTVLVSDTEGVWTTGSSGAAVVDEDFAGFTASADTDLSNGGGAIPSTYTDASGWYGYKVFSSNLSGNACAKLGTTKTNGFITTPGITGGLPTGGKVHFKAMRGGSEVGTLNVQICYDDGDEDDDNDVWTSLKEVTPSEEWQSYSADIPAGSTKFWICFETSAKKRTLLDDVRIVPNGGAGTIKYEATVTAPPYERTADGLTVGQTYWYMVTAWSDGGCTNATGGSATLANVPLIQVRPKEYDFGTVDKNTSVSNTFTVKNTGSQTMSIPSISIDSDPGVTAYTITAIGDRTGLSTTSDSNNGVGWTLAPQGTLAVTVQFAPWRDGERNARLRIRSNAYNANGEKTSSAVYGDWDVALTGDCHDPSTEPVSVYRLEVTDGMGVMDTIADHSLALGTADGTGGELPGALQPTLSVLAWQYNGLDTASARWSLVDPNGTTVYANRTFDSVSTVQHGGKACTNFTARIPNVGAERAVRGAYTVLFTVNDLSGNHGVVDADKFTPPEKGWLVEDFTRSDREATGGGALENGWIVTATDGEAGEAAIHADQLELYGPNGEMSGDPGRISVVRDMGDEEYEKHFEDMVSTVSWGFHFRTGAKTASLADGSTAGAFVLGATSDDWFGTSAAGYAVLMANDTVSLASFSGGLRNPSLAGCTVTALTPADPSKPSAYTNGVAGKWLAVRVDFVPGQEYIADVQEAVSPKLKLYVAVAEGPGGNPLEECEEEHLVCTVPIAEFLSDNLQYAGMVWNHGYAQLSDKTGCAFDDLYFPHQKGQREPMRVHVIDEDTDAPVIDGLDLPTAVAVDKLLSGGGGLTVAGTVHDASGVWTSGSGTAPQAELRVDGAVAWSGAVTLTPAVSGADTNVSLSVTIPAGAAAGLSSSTVTTNCALVLTIHDRDRDRAGDSLAAVSTNWFTLCDSEPAAPAWATVEGDGAEMAVLRWARTAGTTYVVVRSDTEFGARATPTQGTKDEPFEGTVYEGLGTVVYYGTGDNHLTGTWTAREFVVAPGSANYFAVYGMTGNGTTGYFFSEPTMPTDWSWTASDGVKYATADQTAGGMPSTPATAVRSNSWPLVTGTYEPGEGVDAFAYRTSVTSPDDGDPAGKALAFNFETRPETGSGWGGPWTGDTGEWKVHDVSLTTGGTHYPEGSGNKLFWEDTHGGTEYTVKLTRTLGGESASGSFFFAAILNYRLPDGANYHNKWANIALMNGETELVSFGKQGGSSDSEGHKAAIYTSGPFGNGYYNTTTEPSSGYRNGTYDLNSGHGNDYVIVGQMDRGNRFLRMWVFHGNDPIPEIYSHQESGAEVAQATQKTALNTIRASWQWSEGTTVPAITAIRLQAGSKGSETLGHVYFDEVRFAGTWEELFLFNAPEVYKFDFDLPEPGTGIMVGMDDEGHRQWKISDGALAHGDVGLNAQFQLFHRTGISSASFTILDEEGNQILKTVEDNPETDEVETTVPETGGTLASVELSGTTGSAVSDWTTTSEPGVPGGALGVAVPTNMISTNATYTVEVTLTSAGGKEATVTAASETGGGGATDLFFGEYGNGQSWDKYVELYNGTGHDIDLSEYYLARAKKDSTGGNYSNYTWESSARISSTPYILPHHETIVIFSDAGNHGSSDFTDRHARLEAALEGRRFLYLPKNNTTLDAGNTVPVVLFSRAVFEGADANGENENSPRNKPWLDACGGAYSYEGDTVQEFFIMSRKAEVTPLPRENLAVDWSEWDYRRWCTGKYDENDDYEHDYEDFQTTAGAYDRNIGLGGNMEFKVFDDDEVAPVLAASGHGLDLGSGVRAPVAGTQDLLVAGWSFTNVEESATAAAVAAPWSGSIEVSSARLTCSENLGSVERLVEKGEGKGVAGVTFNGTAQAQNGALYFACNDASYNITAEDDVWIGFETDMENMTERKVSFWYASGSGGFKAGHVEVSADGGTWVNPEGWTLAFDEAEGTGGADTFVLFEKSLEFTKSDGTTLAIPRETEHLRFRVHLSERKAGTGTFRMDAIQVHGKPLEVVVTDAELLGKQPEFQATMSDAGSGLDVSSATFGCGVSGIGATPTATLVDGGKSPSALKWQAESALDKAGVQAWYEASEAEALHLRVEVKDADDDRPDDQLDMRGHFGVLRVVDDDPVAPVMASEGNGIYIDGTLSEPEEGSRDLVVAGWSFTNTASAAEAMAVWSGSALTANAALTCCEQLGSVERLVVTGSGNGVSQVEFNGTKQLQNGELYFQCADAGSAPDVWVGFEMDMMAMTEREVSFWYAGGSGGFGSGWVEVSADNGVTWRKPEGWNLVLPTSTKNASTFAEFAQSLEWEENGELAIPRNVGHLMFRVHVAERGGDRGTFRMDCMQVHGKPSEVTVTDGDLVGQAPSFKAKVSDPGSGLDTTSLAFSYGNLASVSAVTPDTSGLVNGGKDAASELSWAVSSALSTDVVHQWFTNSAAGDTLLKVSVKDADDDRTDDQLQLNGPIGLLQIVDDDTEPPEIVMKSLKPRTGNVLGEWLFESKEKANQGVASLRANGLSASDLRARTGDLEPTLPHAEGSVYDGADSGYGAWQMGWHGGNKYWYVRLETLVGKTGDDGARFTITDISFNSKVNQMKGPTAFVPVLLQGVTSIDANDKALAWGTSNNLAGVGGNISLLPSGTAWTADTVKTWKSVNIHPSSSIELAGNSVNELQLWAVGAATNGSLARWYIHDLKIEGTVLYANGQSEEVTYVTDHDLANGASVGNLTGNAWDESGLSEATYKMSGWSASRPLTFTEGAMSSATTENAGAFSVEMSEIPVTYTGLLLQDYRGTVEVWDGDADRTSGDGTVNEDRLKIEGEFGFTVIDQDVVEPTAPSGIAGSGVTLGTAPTYGTAAWNNAPWTNNPEFIVTFTPAEDTAPTAEQLSGDDYAAWRTEHGLEQVDAGQAAHQLVATGIGEYRVAAATDAASLADAPAFSVAAVQGALGNYGFERYASLAPWSCVASGCGINKQKTDNVYPASEGTNSFYIQNYNTYPNAVLTQTIAWTNTDTSAAVEVSGSVDVFKVGGNAAVWVLIEVSETEDFAEVASAEIQLTTSTTSTYPIKTWMTRSFSATLPASDETNETLLRIGKNASFLRITFRCQAATAYLDNARLSVTKGTVGPAMRYEAEQGLATKHLFAVDADNDRLGDRRTGGSVAFYTAYDGTPPTPVHFVSPGTGASTLHVDDPTTQFDLQWNAADVGPDNPADAHHPEFSTKAEEARNKNMLSPWKSYRVYFRKYDPVVLAAEAKVAQGTETPDVAQYLYDTLIDGTTEQGLPKYRSEADGWKHVEFGDPIEDVTSAARTYGNINDRTTSGMRLYDLEFDQEYVVVMAGLDTAGNEGPVDYSSWATNNTIKFSLTRGWHMTKEEAKSDFATHVQSQGVDTDIDLEQRLTNDVVSALEWTAAGTSRDPDSGRMVGNSTKDYDLLHWDARSFRESPDNNWQKIATVRTSWFVDDGGPTNRGSIRFYRASYKDRWKKAVTNATTGQVTAQTPLVSEEVYAQTAVPLRPGWNFVALHGVPYTNTFRAVFGGTENFPGGVSETLQGTSIDFYPAVSSTNGIALDHYWLREDGQWFHYGDEENAVTDTKQDPDFFNRAFSINLPDELPEGDYPISSQEIHHPGGRVETVQTLLWKPILQVPTNGFSQTIHLGTKENPKFNIMALRLPVAAHPSEMGLVVPTAGSTETEGLTPGQPWVADQIYTFDPVTRDTSQACYCRMEDGKPVWRFASGNGLVPAGYFKPNDVLVILSRNGGDPNGQEDRTWTWEYDPADFYPLPHRNMKVTTK